MRRLKLTVSTGLLALAACAASPGIDRAAALEPGYAAREDAVRKPSDRCGPEFISDNLPPSLVAVMAPALDGPFRPVCKRHDACYELRERSQAWCDQRMHEEMIGICNAGRDPASFGARTCRMRAEAYYRMVDNAFGAYAYEGVTGGRLGGAVISAGPDGELEICVTAENNTALLQQYAVELRWPGGARIDRAPGLGARSVRAGDASDFCVGGGQTGGDVELRLLADRTDSLAISGDTVVVETRRIARPGPG